MSIFRIFVGFSLIGATAVAAPAKTAFCLSDTAASFAKADFLKNHGEFLLLSQQYSLIEAVACKDQDKSKARLGYARSLYRLGEKATAEDSLNSLKALPASSAELHQAVLLKAWYESSFRADLAPDDRQKFDAFENAKRDYESVYKVKTPWVAGGLSAVVPGLGQVYNGNYQSAAVAFALNAIFLASAIEFNQHSLKAPMVASSLIFSITYFGNILSSVESAKAINAHAREPGIDHLRAEKIPELQL